MHTKTVALCILRCAEHAYQNGCSVHASMCRAGIPFLMLCAGHRCAERFAIKQLYDVPNMHIGIKCVVATLMRRPCKPKWLLDAQCDSTWVMSKRLLCAYFAAPNMFIKDGCFVQSSIRRACIGYQNLSMLFPMHRACLSKTVALSIL